MTLRMAQWPSRIILCLLYTRLEIGHAIHRVKPWVRADNTRLINSGGGMRQTSLLMLLFCFCTVGFSQTGSGCGLDCTMRDPCMPGDCYDRNDCEDMTSPILIDVEGNGFDFSAPGIGVFFDLYGNGISLHLQWINPETDDAFLAVDLNNNGIVDDGTELFGNGSLLILEQTLAPNGFVALAQYDMPELGGNDDGLITNEDEVWNWLYLWFDTNADGVSHNSEIIAIEHSNLVSLETIPKESPRIDEAGNRLRFWALSRTNSMFPRRMLDVFFNQIIGGQ